ncbi:MAG: P63C domain-containing protein [Rhodospirillales bacterium]|nr:P63C domain-containing protein [Rhodospirillales bacterium]
MSKALKVIAGAPDRPLVIGGVEIQCYVLEDETRVLSQRGLQSAIGMSTGGSRRGTGERRIAAFVGWLGEKGINTNTLTASAASPIEFRPPGGGRTAYAYNAEILVDLCEAVLDAYEKGKLSKQQEHMARRAYTLVRGLTRLGIIGLVDEATGYQHIREERALAAILEKFIAKELRPWTRTFPPEFYEEIFRLKKWPGPDGVKRPSVIGTYTNDIVYDRLAPGVLDELKRKNPPVAPGRRRHKHFQWLTGDVGHPKLKEHLIGVMAVMRASPNWTAFKRNLVRSYPKQDEQIPLALED